MDTPSSSQLPDDIPPIFRKEDGSQWQIFVEAGGIVGRPKLIRILKRAGAALCSDPKQAQVILVDSTSVQGRLFIRDWSNDVNKVVLEYSWVKNSIAAGKALSEADQWGGCLTSDDGLPIMKEEPDDIPNLPPHSRDIPEKTGMGGEYTASQLHEPQDSHPTPEATQQAQNGSLDSNNFFPNQPHPHALSQLLAAQLSQPQLIMQQFPNLMQGFQFQAGPNNVPPNPTQALMAYLNQTYYPFSAPHGVVPWGVPPMQNSHSQPVPFGPQMMDPSSRQLPQDFRSLSGSFSVTHNDHLQSQTPLDLPPSPSSIPPSLRRKSPAVSGSYDPKGKARSISTASSEASHYSLNPQPTSASAPPRSSTQPRALFTSETGQPLSFFVQVDLNSRFSVVSAIKKNGGKITNNHTMADYAILYSRSTTFNDLLRSTLASKRPAISASFVHDSVAQNILLDPSKYKFHIPSKGGKRKRTSTLDGLAEDKLEKRVEKNRRLVDRKRKSSDPAIEQSEPSPSDQSQPRSPTPPPEHTQVPLAGGGGFRFSEHERNYVSRYVKVLLERDHRMSIHAIAQCLFKKMNNHSLASWRSFLSQSFANELEATRKRASIAYRKEQNAKGTQQVLDDDYGSNVEPSQSAQSSKSSSHEVPVIEHEQENLFEEDLKIISQYFAVDGGDSGQDEDEVVWARLTNRVKCQTAKTWEEFYNQHHEEVMARYERLTSTAVENHSTSQNTDT